MPSLATAAKQGLIGTPTATMTRRSEEFGKGRTPNPAEMAQGFVPTATVGDSWTPSTPESAEREWNKRNLRGIAAFVPTATAGDAKAAGSRNTEESEAHEGLSLTDWARGDNGTGRMLPTPNVPNGGRTVHHAVKIGNSYYHKGKKVQVGLDAEVRMMMPTPTSRDHKDGSAESCKNVPVNALLGRAVHQTMWNTPRASMAHGPSEAEIEAGNPNSRIETQAAVLYPTPDLGAAKGRGMKSAESRSRLGGTLNPRFVEELLGYPSGWTDLEL